MVSKNEINFALRAASHNEKEALNALFNKMNTHERIRLIEENPTVARLLPPIHQKWLYENLHPETIALLEVAGYLKAA